VCGVAVRKVVITGGSGTLGSSASLILAEEFEVIATYATNPVKIEGCKTVQLDITDKSSVTKLLKTLMPDVLIHAAAFTNPNLCEISKELAWTVNVQGTRNIAEVCSEIDAKMIYVSSNYIFDGKQGNYDEYDIPNPVSFYGATKLKGENAVKIFDLNYTIVRTTPYGWSIVQDKPNFATWSINKLKNKEIIFALTDQYNSPILTTDCAKTLGVIIEKDAKGIYNIAGPERINRYDFTKKLAKIFGLNDHFIEPLTCEQILKKGFDKAKRPRDTSLNISKAVRDLAFKPANIDEGLTMMKQLENPYYKSVSSEQNLK
jgi:dTDP-4-dehydrorhamnose reductase